MARLELSTRKSTSETKKAVKSPVSKAAKTAKPAKKFFVKTELHNFISQDKIDVLNHDATDTIWIGAKEGGKTRPVVLDALSDMEENYKANAVMMKKYKTNATNRLHPIVNNLALEVKAAGYTIPDYEKGQTMTYRMKAKNRNKNQTIEYASFDDYNQIAGIEAPNNGYFSVVIVEEPVLLQDEKPVPTPQEWKDQMEALKDSISRSNDRYMSITGLTIKPTKYHYTMNPWDDHPLVMYAEKHHPMEEFMQFVLEDMLNNNIMVKYVVDDDTLIVRNTKFNNPKIRIIEQTCKDLDIKNLEDFEEKKDEIDWEAKVFKDLGIIEGNFFNHLKKYKGTLLKRAELAIESNDSGELSRILGFKYDGESTMDKTHNQIELAQLVDSKSIHDNADAVSKLAISFDIDHRRRIVLTPVYSVKKKRGIIALNENDWVGNVVVGEQITIPCSGTGKKGEKLDVYREQMLKAIADLRKKYHKAAANGVVCALDDPNRFYINILSSKTSGIIWRLAKKHAEWDILNRVSAINIGIERGVLMFDEKNARLMSDMKKSIIKTGTNKRDETGKREKDYDYINSMEYGVYYHREGIVSINIPGNEYNYKGD